MTFSTDFVGAADSFVSREMSEPKTARLTLWIPPPRYGGSAPSVSGRRLDKFILIIHCPRRDVGDSARDFPSLERKLNNAVNGQTPGQTLGSGGSAVYLLN